MVPKIGISIGDFNGIGPEIILKTLRNADLKKSTPVIFTPPEIIDFYSSHLSLETEYNLADQGIKEHEINILPLESPSLELTPGVLTTQSGKTAMASIQKALNSAISKEINAFVTAPISKEAVNLAGYDIPGHTEYLAKQTGTASVVMMLINKKLRVALATTHIPVSKVASSITEELLKEKLSILNSSMVKDFGIPSPRIAVFGLNPHAGDGGIIGKEEQEIISPVLKQFRGEGLRVHGPFPADGFFGQKLHEEFDAVLAMYHDQGLAPFKLLSFGKGVNFTAGLPIIRTSPDHGTAFDIAGKGIANPSSFNEAYNLAVQLANKKVREAQKG